MADNVDVELTRVHPMRVPGMLHRQKRFKNIMRP